jgi:hypothetical protein
LFPSLHDSFGTLADEVAQATRQRGGDVVELMAASVEVSDFASGGEVEHFTGRGRTREARGGGFLHEDGGLQEVAGEVLATNDCLSPQRGWEVGLLEGGE